MEALLKASEASALMGLSVRHVQRMAKSGELPYQTHMNERNRPEYLFPLSSLPDAAQQKYFAEHAPAALPAAAPAKAKKADKPAACKPLEAYTAEERGEIGYWITTVDRWQTYRNKAGTKKAECDEKFVLLCRMEEPDRQISVETLYRKWAAIREGDYGALVDMRGKARKGMSKMPEAIERVFLSLFLDESQLPVPRCIALTEEWAQQNMPEAMPLPGYHTFYRKAKAVPYPVMVLCRMGEKKYYDLCSPYIRREYESINANDFWVTFGEYDSSLQHTDSAKEKYLDGVRSTFDACKTSFMTQAMIGGEAWAKPVPMPDGRLTWQIVGRDSVIILGRDASGIPSDVALCEKSVSADHHFYTLVERRTSFAGRLTIQYRLYCSDNKSTLGRRVPLASLPQYERLEDEYTFAVPIDGVGMVFLRMPITNCVDGSADGVSIYEPAMGLIHRINENELQFSREFELGRMRVVASADILRTHNGKKSLTDDVFVGLDGNEQSVGITPFAPALRNESYEARRQTYLKAIENLLGIKRGILSDAEAVSKTATEINSSAGDYSLSIMDFQHLYYDALQAALRLGDQIGQAYRLCDASAWDADELAVTWGNGVLYDADQEWTERKELVQMGLLKPELALAWKFDLPAETEADLAEIRKNYMPELKDLEG